MPGCVNRKVIATLNCAASVRARFAIRGESWLPVGKGGSETTVGCRAEPVARRANVQPVCRVLVVVVRHVIRAQRIFGG